jgi:hypothetical protein
MSEQQIPLGHLPLFPDCLDLVGRKKFGKAWLGAVAYALRFDKAVSKPTNDVAAARSAARADYALCQRAEDLLAVLLYGTPGAAPEVAAGIVNNSGHWLVINRNFWGNHRAATSIIESGRARDAGGTGSPDWRGSKGNRGVQDFFEGPVSIKRSEIESAIERHIQPDVAARSGTAAVSLAGARTACREWLVPQMQAGDPLKTKALYRQQAMALFKGLAARGFNVAWDEAIDEAGNPKWSKPGPKKPIRSGNSSR